jgi:hypothetical protein
MFETIAYLFGVVVIRIDSYTSGVGIILKGFIERWKCSNMDWPFQLFIYFGCYIGTSALDMLYVWYVIRLFRKRKPVVPNSNEKNGKGAKPNGARLE